MKENKRKEKEKHVITTAFDGLSNLNRVYSVEQELNFFKKSCKPWLLISSQSFIN